ncbi:MAG TPA: LacI family DNA-binding transcriptional regulator [Rhodoglobus sp.]|nr:LacI family DNA-binding transcriptional regulator [Rhodoglobus sp.]
MSAPGERSARVTMKDVARSAGVSLSTTSRALSGSGYVAETVRIRVRRAADELGYVVDVTARGLKQRSSLVIGVMVSDLRSSFYAEMASGAGRRARQAGYTMMLVEDGGNRLGELDAVNALVGLRVAGVVLTPASDAAADFLRRRRVPVVEVDRVFGDGDAVLNDDRAAARAATEHLLELGHRRIAFVMDETEWSTARERHAGYVEALEAAGLVPEPSLVVTASSEAVTDDVRRLLASSADPTAVLAVNSSIAERIWRAAAELGVGLPDRLSLIAFDDARWMRIVEPGVTAVAQDAARLGAEAVSMLIERISDPGREPVRVIVPAAIVIRGSTAPPRAAGIPARTV